MYVSKRSNYLDEWLDFLDERGKYCLLLVIMKLVLFQITKIAIFPLHFNQ